MMRHVRLLAALILVLAASAQAARLQTAPDAAVVTTAADGAGVVTSTDDVERERSASTIGHTPQVALVASPTSVAAPSPHGSRPGRQHVDLHHIRHRASRHAATATTYAAGAHHSPHRLAPCDYYVIALRHILR